jgi:hypothetical protein
MSHAVISLLRAAVQDTDGNPPDRAEDPPFNVALAGSIGIFGYEITDVFNAAGAGTNGCVKYDDTFGKQTAYPSLATAQFCSIIAPIFAGIALFACMVDMCVCNFSGSFTIGSLLFLVASGIQAGVFTLLADPAFWYVSSTVCIFATELCHILSPEQLSYVLSSLLLAAWRIQN